MKQKFLLLALTAILAFNQTKAQFNSITDCGANGVGHSIFFINPDTGFVAGEDIGKGVIQKTVDGGNTWTRVYTSTTNLEWIYDIYFANSTTGVAVGENGTILHTVDGGTTWNHQTVSNVNSFNAVCYPTSTVGYATGAGTPQGPIYKTTDGGINWTAQVSNADSALGSIFFVNADTGYAVSSSDILKTTNGGTTWIRSNNNYSSGGSIYCTDVNTCYISGLGNPMIKTIDGGNTWNALSLPLLPSPYLYVAVSIYFTNEMTGYAVGAKFDTTNSTGTGVILKTTNAGQTWYNINTTGNNDTLQNRFLGSVRFVNSQIGYTTGSKGKVLKTINAGGLSTGIAYINNETIEMNVYPNPLSSSTTLQTNIFLHNATLTVDNCFGQTVAQIKNIKGQTITFHRDNLASGLYFVHLTQDNQIMMTKKLLITDN